MEVKVIVPEGYSVRLKPAVNDVLLVLCRPPKFLDMVPQKVLMDGVPFGREEEVKLPWVADPLGVESQSEDGWKMVSIPRYVLPSTPTKVW